jgi:hypothetical protein
MKTTSIILALLAGVTGLVAAAYWYRGSGVKIVPRVGARFGGMAAPGAPWLSGSLDAFKEAARLNKIASLWTAASVFLGAASSVIGAFANSN